jgi:hypothetical protein
MNALRRIATTIAVSMFGTILALSVLEVCLRVAGSGRSPQGPQWSDRPLFYFRSPQAPTMQGYPHSETKPEGGFRVGVVGDSFTFAPYMQFTDTFASKLEQMLKVNGAPRPVEVINYGVPAYSTSHEVGAAKTALKEGADLILLQITLNDPELKPQQPTGITENMADRFGPMKLSGSLAWLANHWRTLRFVLTRLHNTKTHQDYIDYFNDLFENPRTWKPFVSSMKDLVSQAKSTRTPIVAVVFPLFGLPMDEHYPFYKIHTKVADLMKSLDVPLLDVSEIYKGIPLEHLQVIPGVDRHPNEIAHRMAAEKIYLWLEQQSLIPDEFVIKEKFATRLGIRDQRPWTNPMSAQPETNQP